MKKNKGTLLACICVAAIAVITFFVFSPSLDDGFTNWDDNFYVTDNPLVVNNSVPVVKIFETPLSANYHPITVLSLALNYQTGKLAPFGYHLVNIIFHIFNTILVFFFIFLLTRRNLLMAAIVSLFFGIHPMHVESVTWISERKDVLYVFFFLLGLITYLRYNETKKTVWYIFTFILFILSCLSKGMAVVFPVILLLIDYLQGVKWERRLWLEKIPFFVLSIVFGVVAVRIQLINVLTSKIHPILDFSVINNYTIFQRLIFASYGATMYIAKLFVPYKLSAFYPYPNTAGINSISPIFYFSPFILLSIFGVLIYFFRTKKKEIVFGLLFYFVSIVLVLQFISVGRVIMADRYTYLSYIGLLFIIAYLINKAWQNKSSIVFLIKYLITVITIIFAIVFSYQAYSRTQVWKNSEVLWMNVINNYPDASMAYFKRANYYFDVNELSKAISDYTKTINIDSNFVMSYNDRAMVYYKENEKSNLELADYNKAILLDSTYADAYSNRGLFYYKNFKDNSALSDFNKAIALDSTSASYYYNRGIGYKAINEYQNAINDLTKGIKLNPQRIELYYNMRGICNISLQKYNEAIADFSKAINLNPFVSAYLFNRSFAEGKTGQNEAARADELKGHQLQGK